MAYMTLKEANENRGVLSRQDNYFCGGGLHHWCYENGRCLATLNK